MSNLVLLAALVLWGAAFVMALSTPAPGSDAAPAAPAEPRGELDRFIGFALGVHYVGDVKRYTDAIDEIAALGCGAVELVTPIYQTHGGTTDLVRDPSRCPTDAQLEAIIKHAKAKGLAVHLMPIVLYAEPRDNEWRGKLMPDDWDAWWSNYTTHMLRFARLAQRSGVDMFSVGSELLSTEDQTERWHTLIGKVRATYRGRLLYSTNWDHYHEPAFWDRLDLVGINGYWRLTDDAAAASDADLVKRWREIRKQVMAFAGKKGKPVVFTEIGYPSLPWGLKDPWNYVAEGGTEATPDVQRRGYEAFLECWADQLTGQPPSGARTHLKGVFFYEWDIHHPPGPGNTGYGVKGKPTYELLKTFLNRRSAE